MIRTLMDFFGKETKKFLQPSLLIRQLKKTRMKINTRLLIMICLDKKRFNPVFLWSVLSIKEMLN